MNILHKETLFEDWATWLDKYHWDWWATLTFKKPTDIEKANLFVSEWLGELEVTAGDRLPYIMIVDFVKNSKNTPRYHIFLANTNNIKARIWQKRWHELGGIGRLMLYNPQNGAKFYLNRFVKTNLENIIYSCYLKYFLNLQDEIAQLLNIIDQLERDSLPEDQIKNQVLAIANA